MSSTIFSNMHYLKGAMDASWRREEVILDNIANVDTSNFKRSTVSFEDQYRRAINEGPKLSNSQTREGHRPLGFDDKEVNTKIIKNTTTSNGMNGNNVDMDVEQTELARNVLYYNTLQRQINSEYAQLRMAIREGR